MVLSADSVDRVERLLDEGELSQRAIARETGVSRGSVHRIKTGKRVLCRANGHALLPGPSGPLGRCPGCGGMVQQPCITCRARESNAPRLSGDDDVDALGLHLKPDDRARQRKLKGDR